MENNDEMPADDANAEDDGDEGDEPETDSDSAKALDESLDTNVPPDEANDAEPPTDAEGADDGQPTEDENEEWHPDLGLPPSPIPITKPTDSDYLLDDAGERASGTYYHMSSPTFKKADSPGAETESAHHSARRLGFTLPAAKSDTRISGEENEVSTAEVVDTRASAEADNAEGRPYELCKGAVQWTVFF